MKVPRFIQHRYLMYLLVNLRITYDLHNIYRVIQEEGSVFWCVIVALIVRRKSSYDHVSNYEW